MAPLVPALGMVYGKCPAATRVLIHKALGGSTAETLCAQVRGPSALPLRDSVCSLLSRAHRLRWMLAWCHDSLGYSKTRTSLRR